MSERRSLAEGLKATPVVDPAVAKEFIRGGAPATPVRQPSPAVTTEPSVPVVSRAPLSTRVRADFATALKRASLERQLKGVEPNTLQDILEEAIEPWLKSNGYLQ